MKAHLKDQHKLATELLVGRTIVGITYDLKKYEREALGVYENMDPPLLVVLDNGDVLFAMRDPEGNGPGSLHLSDGEEVKLF